MKYSLSLLLPLLLSSASARTSIRRYLSDNAPLLITNAVAGSSTGGIEGSPFGAGMDAPDMSCMLSMATDNDSCEQAVDVNGVTCVWCSMGGDLGGCVGSDIADIVNSAEIPHLHCGTALSEEDEVFFDDLKTCVVEGDTFDKCNGPSITSDGTACTWCVTVNEPYFATCFSEAFVAEAQTLDAATGILSSVVDCSPQAPKGIGAITDMHCLTDGNPEDGLSDATAEVCVKTNDAQGNPCVVANLFGMMDVCVTDTQKATLDYLVDQMGAMGIDNPMSIFGGAPGAVGVGDDWMSASAEVEPVIVDSALDEDTPVEAAEFAEQERAEYSEESGQ